VSDPGSNAEALETTAARVASAPAISLRAWLLHGSLFLITFLTTTSFGSGLAESFRRNSPLDPEVLLDNYLRLAHLDPELWAGLYFSIPLLSILLAHELGHYLECRRRGVDASLPYFLPSPLMFGTFGAFIRIRSPIYSREALFDIGIKGPLAGFIVLLPFLVTGVWLSKLSAASAGSQVVFGSPAILAFLEHVRFPGVAAAHIVLHPIAVAAWVGLFATALNLLPIGQLDGGHILYSVGGSYLHRRIGLAVVALLALAGFFYWPWWLWSAVMFFFGRRHLLIYDTTPISRPRLALASLAFLIFVLSATIVPVHGL
jgi:hypothetical protein